MSDLVTFLRARLDEREAAAKAAGGQRWLWHSSRPGEVVAPSPDMFRATRIDAVSSDYRTHIVLNDPQFVLADVAAKRRIVDEFSDVGEWLPANRDDDEPEYAYGRARTLHEVIKRLAAPFAQHPDFDPAWAVDQT